MNVVINDGEAPVLAVNTDPDEVVSFETPVLAINTNPDEVVFFGQTVKKAVGQDAEAQQQDATEGILTQ